MNQGRVTLLLAIVCCLVIILAPVSVSAQGVGGVVHGAKQGVEKGAGEVEKGVEGAAQKTEEGAEAVGKGVKKAVTGKDNETTTDREKGSEMNPESQPSGNESGETQTTEAGEKNLPSTAGELPLLALFAILCLVAAGRSRIIRVKR
jgi:hypothetical protein